MNRIENGRMQASSIVKTSLQTALEQLNPENPLTMLFDYVRIRFPTLDVGHIISDVLRIKMEYMLHENYGFFSYAEHYVIGDIFVLTSLDAEKGVLLELRGRGCRQFESYLLAQHRSWYDFLTDAYAEGGVMKRLDLAINDRTGILDIPELIRKCKREECISVFRKFKSYDSGELVRNQEQDKLGMGNTLYIGSLSSEVYFCIYQKDYEQYAKFNIPLEETPIKNRFEIRLKNDRAFHAVCDLLTYQDAERTAFSIINRYVRFADREKVKRRKDWKTNARWAYFIGSDRDKLKLTTKPEPYTLERTMAWLERQVAPTLKLVEKLDEIKKSNVFEQMVHVAKLSERHKKIIRQQTISPEDIIT